MFVSVFESFARKKELINFDKIDDRFDWRQNSVCLFLWLSSFRYLLASIASNPIIWSLIGDPFHYTNDRVLINLVLFGISMLGTLCETTMLIGEIIIIISNYILFNLMFHLKPNEMKN